MNLKCVLYPAFLAGVFLQAGAAMPANGDFNDAMRHWISAPARKVTEGSVRVEKNDSGNQLTIETTQEVCAVYSAPMILSADAADQGWTLKCELRAIQVTQGEFFIAVIGSLKDGKRFRMQLKEIVHGQETGIRFLALQFGRGTRFALPAELKNVQIAMGFNSIKGQKPTGVVSIANIQMQSAPASGASVPSETVIYQPAAKRQDALLPANGDFSNGLKQWISAPARKANDGTIRVEKNETGSQLTIQTEEEVCAVYSAPIELSGHDARRRWTLSLDLQITSVPQGAFSIAIVGKKTQTKESFRHDLRVFPAGTVSGWQKLELKFGVGTGMELPAGANQMQLAFIFNQADGKKPTGVVSLANIALKDEVNSTIKIPELSGKPDREIVYKTVDGAGQRLFLFLPADWRAEDRRPLMMMFHGGGWHAGTPDAFFEQCRYYASRGFVAVSVEYRLADSALTPDSLFRTVMDAKSAVRYARKHAPELGADPDKIITAGSSAGAHLAIGTALLDLNDRHDDLEISSVPAAAVLMCPVVDTGPAPGYRQAYEKLQNQYQRFSPYHNLSGKIPPQLILLGDRDVVLSVGHAKAYVAKAIANGGDCELEVYRNARHAEFYRGHFFTESLPDVEIFLKKRQLFP